ncbi:protein FAM114A2 [Trichomycterus rosablanca]|uniref:protein FAM114A2 n=1 Tax=Trichomycterus rosablanca TaxID=2290929 RepID=UPI002F35F1C8
MSDKDCPASDSEESMEGKVSKEPSSPLQDVSSPDTQTDSSDVAPTRKTRQRPENKPSPEVQETAQTPSPTENTPNASTPTAVAQGGWGGWGSWGKSLLSTATATVATVGQGLSQVIEKAETSLGIPSPKELSEQVEKEEKTYDQSNNEEDKTEGEGNTLGSAMGMLSSSSMGMLSSLSSVVQSTSKTVISGGLDALEFIGKKTMDVIAEGDPGFKKTKGLMNRTSTLSQVLREAKEQEQQTAEKQSSDGSETVKKAHYGMLFDEFQGLSHLEALEILSRESEAKVKSVLTTLSGEKLTVLRDELEQIKDSFYLSEFDDDEEDDPKVDEGENFVKELTDALEQLHITTTAEKLAKARKNVFDRITDIKLPTEATQEEEDSEQEATVAHCTVDDAHVAAITSLAEFTARSIEQFHKMAEMLLHSSDGETSALEQAKVLAQITIVLCKEISLLSKKFTACLTMIGSKEKAEVLNPLITGVFLEASNSASYIQDAFQLLMPVLEVSYIQKTVEAGHR